MCASICSFGGLVLRGNMEPQKVFSLRSILQELSGFVNSFLLNIYPTKVSSTFPLSFIQIYICIYSSSSFFTHPSCTSLQFCSFFFYHTFVAAWFIIARGQWLEWKNCLFLFNFFFLLPILFIFSSMHWLHFNNAYIYICMYIYVYKHLHMNINNWNWFLKVIILSKLYRY